MDNDAPANTAAVWSSSSTNGSVPGPTVFAQALGAIVSATRHQVGECSSKPPRGSTFERKASHLLEMIRTRGEDIAHIRDDPLQTCDALMAELEQDMGRSAIVSQLFALLDKPHIRALLVASSDVSAGRFAPRLPSVELSDESNDEQGGHAAMKIVRMQRKPNEPLGATIQTDAAGRVFVARIATGGVAHRTGFIEVGDRLVEVNGVQVSGRQPAEVGRIISASNSNTLTMKLVPSALPSSLPVNSATFVRALFDWEPSTDDVYADRCLRFWCGDILQVETTERPQHWHARRVASCAVHVAAATDGSYTENSATTKPGTSANAIKPVSSKWSLSSVAASPARTAALHVSTPSLAVPDLTNDSSDQSGLIPSQSAVEQRTAGRVASEEPYYEQLTRWMPTSSQPRAIVLLGAAGVGRGELRRRILRALPERYALVVPYTSRPPRPDETDGVHYHFTTRDILDRWTTEGAMLESGEFRGHIYGTAKHTVRAVLHDAAANGGGPLPLLTPHPMALLHLRTAEFRPLVIYIQPPERDVYNKMHSLRPPTARPGAKVSAVSKATTTGSPHDNISDEDVEQMYLQAAQIERHYGHVMDARIVNAHFETAFGQLLSVLSAFATEPSWMPLDWLSAPDSS